MRRLSDVIPNGLPGHLSLFPECLCGFPPKHLHEMLERLDCPTCQKIITQLEQVTQLSFARQQRVEDAGIPTRKRNEERQRTNQAWQQIPIIGRFVGEPKLDEEPHCHDEIWYIEYSRQIRTHLDETDALRAQDTPHWGDPKNLSISQGLMARCLGKNHVYGT